MLVIGTLPCPCATVCARSSKEEYTLNVLVSSTCSPAKQQKETGPPDLCQYSTRPTSCGQTVTTWLYVMPCRKKTWTCLVTVADVLTCGNDFFFRHIFSYTSFWHMQARTHVHLMLLALFFSSFVPSIAEPLINGLFFKKKREKNSVEYPVCYRQKSPASEPCNFSKKKKKTKKSRCVCALSSYYGP